MRTFLTSSFFGGFSTGQERSAGQMRPSTWRSGCTELGDRRSLNARNPSPPPRRCSWPAYRCGRTAPCSCRGWTSPPAWRQEPSGSTGRARRGRRPSTRRAAPTSRPRPVLGLGRGQRAAGDIRSRCGPGRSGAPAAGCSRCRRCRGTARAPGTSAVADHSHVAAQRDCRPPPWHSPLTAETTGLVDWRSFSNGVTSIPSAAPNVSQLSSPPPPRSPPGAKTCRCR